MPQVTLEYDRSLDEAAGRYAGTGTERRAAAREEFVTEALPFADRLASRYRGRGVPFDDLRQVARLGLIKAVDHLEPERGSFTAYAAVTVRGELRRHFRNTGWDVHVPRPVQELTLELWKAVDDLTHELSRPPSRAELAARLGAPAGDVEAAMRAAGAYSTRSLNAPAAGSTEREDEAAELGELLGDPDADLESVDDRITVRRLLRRLPAREQRILALRFYGNRSQNEIARATGVSQMHVSRLLTRALSWLREAMLSDTPPPWPGTEDEINPHDLVLGVVNHGGVVVVAVHGEVDADSAPRLRSELEFYCRHARGGVRVDLRRMPFLDAAGAAALAGAYAVARTRGVGFALVNASATAARTLRVAGLGRLVARR